MSSLNSQQGCIAVTASNYTTLTNSPTVLRVFAIQHFEAWNGSKEYKSVNRVTDALDVKL